jgi:tetratricopeptide (TPR) repeat protein
MKTIDFSYFIERYNAGEMSDAEKLWFKKELDGDKNLRKEVSIRSHTDDILKNKDVISLRNKLSDIEKMRAARVPVKRTKNSVYLKSAIILAILIITGSIVIFPGKNLNNDEILSRYYKEYQPTAAQRSLETNADENFTQAQEYFDSHDYKNAALYFSKVVENNPKNMTATFFNGLSNFEYSKFIEAKKSFGKVIDDNRSLFVDQAQWYLALCYLQTDENDKAIKLFEVIRNEGGYYSRDAKKIIRKIK